MKNLQALIAHRGASSEAPENTLAAIRRALEIGVDAIEIDVHLSADGHLVVHHDAMVGRTSLGSKEKRISDMTLVEIQKLDAGSWFSKEFASEKIPTLKEVLELVEDKTTLMIEVKRGYAALEPLAAAVAETVSPKSGHFVGSFSADLLKEVKALNPKLPLIGIIEKPHLLESFDTLKPQKMALWYKLLTPDIVAEFQKKEREVWTFTVDDPTTADFLISMGVTGIITNRPSFLSEYYRSSDEKIP